jgi:hypothetical protein
VSEIFETRRTAGRIGVGFAVALVAAGCAGKKEDTASRAPDARKPGIEVVNASRRDVMVRWFPKADEPDRGSAVVPGCTTQLLEIHPGEYSLVVSSPHGLVRLGWGVSADFRCCLAILRDGRVDATPDRPATAACS